MKLYRSRNDKKLFGLCAGLAESFEVDVTLLRLLLVVTAFFSAGTAIIIYLLACLVIPLKEEEPLEPAFSLSPYGYQAYQQEQPTIKTGYPEYPAFSENEAQLDKLMNDLEKKTLQEEIEALKQQLAQYEKGEK